MWRRYNVGCMNDGGGNMWHGWVDNVSIRWRSQKGLTARARWIGGSSEGGDVLLVGLDMMCALL